MKVASIKGAISGVVGALGAATAVIMGFAQSFALVGFGMFFFTLLIQYVSIKFKVATALSTLIGLSALFANGGAPP